MADTPCRETNPTKPGDDVAQLFEDLTIDELAEQAADALRMQRREAGEDADTSVDLTEAELDAARARARQIIDETRAAQAEAKAAGDEDAGALAGMQDMHALSLSIGLPVPRILFDQIIEASTATPARKKTWRRQVQAMSDVKETGCIQADFFDTRTREKNTAYLVLEECGEDHDLGAQLDKVFSRIAPEKQDEIKKHLSMLIYLGRSAYGQMMMKMMPTLSKAVKKIPIDAEEKEFDPRVLGVDPTTTTLVVTLPGTRRVGIFVRLADEVTATPANTPSGSASDPAAGAAADE
jgi:hypothetical protein